MTPNPAVIVIADNADALKRYCKQRDLSIIASHDAEGHLQQAIADACEHGALLVAGALADVATNTMDVVRLGRRLNEAGANLALVDQNIDTTETGASAVFDLLAAMADLEYHRLGDRLPFGYAVADDLEHIVLDPEEADVIRRIVDWHHDGVTLIEIAGRLNDENIPPRRAEQWDADAVKNVVDHAVTSRWEYIEEGN